MHLAVMVGEVVELLSVGRGGVYIDGTVGSGGHAAAILDAAGPGCRLLGIDRDAEALGRARERLAGRRDACELVRGDFADMAGLASGCGITAVDGILLDLGVSSDQLESAERGFSFEQDGPLDMRMDRSQPTRAADLVNALSEAELKLILREFGEEPRAGGVARRIVSAREASRIETTAELSRLAVRAWGGRRGRRHPATRTFQALRIAVNRELDSLAAGLAAGLRLLKPGGRMAVISFHSLEDRIVKHAFARHAGRWESLPAGGREWRGEEPAVRRVTRKPVRPSEEEAVRNPRARSAKLRVAERC